MNTNYRLVWNATSNKWVVASELAKERKKKSAGLRLAVLSLALAAASPLAASAADSCELSSGVAGVLDAKGTCVAQTNPGTRSLITPNYSAGGGNDSGDTTSVVIGSGATGGDTEFPVRAVAIGNQATTGIFDSAVAIGNNANAAGVSSTAIGSSAGANANGAAAYGRLAKANGSSSLALGDSAVASVDNTVAIGSNSLADRAGTVSVGAAGSERQIVNVAAGTAATDAVNFGQLTGTATSIANALGGNSTVNADGTITAPSYTILGSTQTTIGGALNALNTQVDTNTGDIAGITTQLGELAGSAGLVTQADGASDIAVGGATGGTTVNFAGTGGNRILSGIANGTDDSDAVTIAQLKAVGLIDPIGDPLAAVAYDDLSLGMVTLGGTNGTVINNLANGLIASGSLQAVNGGQLFDMQQNFQSQFDLINGQIGGLNDRVGTIETGIADGSIGGGGGSSSGSGENSTQIGNGAVASGENSTATGAGSLASGDNSTANGAGAVASGSGSTAVGQGAVASGENSTALGSNSKATADNSVALGSGSVADRENTVSVGSAGNERQITNVAAGTAPTDAVNVAQLDAAKDWSKNYTDQQVSAVNQRVTQMGRVADAGIAGAMAMANIPQPYAANQSAIGAGVGSFRGQSALAVGVSTITPSGRWVLKGSLMTNTQGDAGVGVGAAMVW
jgi:trimeric autotransporter adhesin